MHLRDCNQFLDEIQSNSSYSSSLISDNHGNRLLSTPSILASSSSTLNDYELPSSSTSSSSSSSLNQSQLYHPDQEQQQQQMPTSSFVSSDIDYLCDYSTIQQQQSKIHSEKMKNLRDIKPDINHLRGKELHMISSHEKLMKEFDIKGNGGNGNGMVDGSMSVISSLTPITAIQSSSHLPNNTSNQQNDENDILPSDEQLYAKNLLTNLETYQQQSIMTTNEDGSSKLTAQRRKKKKKRKNKKGSIHSQKLPILRINKERDYWDKLLHPWQREMEESKKEDREREREQFHRARIDLEEETEAIYTC